MKNLKLWSKSQQNTRRNTRLTWNVKSGDVKNPNKSKTRTGFSSERSTHIQIGTSVINKEVSLVQRAGSSLTWPHPVSRAPLLHRISWQNSYSCWLFSFLISTHLTLWLVQPEQQTITLPSFALCQTMKGMSDSPGWMSPLSLVPKRGWLPMGLNYSPSYV